MKQSLTRSIVSKTIAKIALSVILGLTASYSHAQTDDFTKALEARVAARWDFEAERKKDTVGQRKVHRFLGWYRIPYQP